MLILHIAKLPSDYDMVDGGRTAARHLVSNFSKQFPEVLDEFMSSTPDFDPIRLSLEFYNS